MCVCVCVLFFQNYWCWWQTGDGSLFLLLLLWSPTKARLRRHTQPNNGPTLPFTDQQGSTCPGHQSVFYFHFFFPQKNTKTRVLTVKVPFAFVVRQMFLTLEGGSQRLHSTVYTQSIINERKNVLVVLSIFIHPLK